MNFCITETFTASLGKLTGEERKNGMDVFHPQIGEVRSGGPEGITCWFIDIDHNAGAWATLHSGTSRSFDKPESGCFAVKTINHFGNEVMKVFWAM